MPDAFNQVTLLTSTDDADVDGSLVLRQVFPATLLSAVSGNKCQLKVLSGKLNADVTLPLFTGSFFGQSSTGGINFTGNQVRVTWKSGGSALTATATAQTTYTSDLITLGENFDNTKAYVFSYDTSSTGAGSYSQAALTGASLQFNNFGTALRSSVTHVSSSAFTVSSNIIQFVAEIIITPAATTPTFPYRKIIRAQPRGFR